jgi:hypothetical protein
MVESDFLFTQVDVGNVVRLFEDVDDDTDNCDWLGVFDVAADDVPIYTGLGASLQWGKVCVQLNLAIIGNVLLDLLSQCHVA